MIVKLLTEHHLACLSIIGGCRGSSESTHDKMPHCWKSHVLAHIMHVVILLIDIESYFKQATLAKGSAVAQWKSA